jgi:crotonobetainyl-CoA:carnitine CoA-transferase CaiB-like acyl-CoA transferase
VPYYDGTMEAKAGRMWEFGVLHGGERPGFAASPVLAHTAAMLILQGAFGALHERLRTGRGQRIETSLAQAYSVHDLIRWPPGGSMDLRTEDIPFIPYTVARTRDGVWLQFAQNGPALFNDFLAALGLAGLGDYGEVMQPQDPENTRGVRARILERIGERTWEEWQEVFENERNVSAELFWAPGEALDHPQFQAMGDVLEIDDPEVGRTRQLGPIVEWQSLPSRPSGPAPSLGSLGDAGFQMPRLDDGPASPAAPQPGVLAGVTVVEFATWIATPFAASLLVDLGARVIKVEPLAGDPMRSTGPALALKMMQGKESLCLDLKAPEAKEVVHRLVARADAMLHSYRPGVPERLGLDFDTLRAINPRLVHLYNGSYGSRGPKAFAAAFHVTGGAVAGGCFAQAGEGVPPPPDQPLDAARARQRGEPGLQLGRRRGRGPLHGALREREAGRGPGTRDAHDALERPHDVRLVRGLPKGEAPAARRGPEWPVASLPPVPRERGLGVSLDPHAARFRAALRGARRAGDRRGLRR